MNVKKFFLKHYFLILLILATLMFLGRYAVIGYGINGDGDNYYMYLPSMFIDGDLDFSNQVEDMPWITATHQFASIDDSERRNKAKFTLDHKGSFNNIWPIGTSLFWSPFFLVSMALTYVLSFLGISIALNGYNDINQILTLFGSLVFAVLGLFLSYKITQLFVASQKLRKIGMLPLILGTFALQYVTVDPSYPHAISFFISTLFVYIYLKSIYLNKDVAWYVFVLFGFVGGLMCAVRLQNGLWFFLPIILFIDEWYKQLIVWKRFMFYFCAACMSFVGLLPYFIASFIRYGMLYSSGQASLITTNFAVFDILFSFRHSLITSTPIIGLAILGLFIPKWESAQKPLQLAFVTVLLTSIVFNASIADWWAGDAFGARRFTTLLVIFIVGFVRFSQHAITQQWFTSYAVMVILLVAFNLIYFLVFNLSLIPRSDAVMYGDTLMAFFGFFRNLLF